MGPLSFQEAIDTQKKRLTKWGPLDRKEQGYRNEALLTSKKKVVNKMRPFSCRKT